ncbi:MAG: hypothetical protein UY58_C0003G0033 [Candidatus Magasanikbacteria bacterium GW2011_GWA2_50_22]|nr:MAG: hypothetical protein UY58_C0003G0033 [Candidatus Magasanikbacteria bacterium GW2011_GWA2_50_22]
MGIKFSPMAFAAVFSVVIFLAALGWRATRTIETLNPNSFSDTSGINGLRNNDGRVITAGATVGAQARAYATSSDPNNFSNVQYDVFGQLLGAYVELKNSGTYTEGKGVDLANRIAETTMAPVAYAEITRDKIKTDADVSRERVIAYRSDLQTALAQLLLNTESELGIFNRYAQTQDKHHLETLREVAGRYHKTVSLLSAMTVPKDALDYHLGITNSLLEFATTLDAMMRNADDPMATLALLRTYNMAEENVYASFNSLASYEKRKIL